MKLHIKSILKRSTALMLSCLMVYGSFAVFASALADGSFSASPPAYMKALSELVKSTADENAFGRIELTVGSPEMSIDGSTRQISPDESQAPVIEGGEVLIPKEVLDIDSDNVAKSGTESAAEVPESDNTLLTVDELEARGYEVTCDSMSGTILITEPFQSMRLVVKTKTGNVKNTYGATTVIKVSNNKTVLQYASKEEAKSASEKLSADAAVIFCEQDSICTIHDTAGGEAAVSYKSWGTTRVGADEYMNSLPDASALHEVVVAVIDTGIDVDHPFLGGRIKDGGWDFVNNDSDPDDDNSHGSHCSGIITDATKSNVKILPVKVMNAKGSGSVSVIVEGMMYAVDSGADIISMSLGGGGDKELYTDAVTYARNKNVPCVVSAGNSRYDLNLFSIYPAKIPDAITVSSSNEGDAFSSSFSNYGAVIDLCAPGENILSAVPGGKFGLKSGTSMSTPLVAAGAALLKSTDISLTPDEICAELCKKASDRGIPGEDDYFGAGMLNLRAYQGIQSMSFETSAITLETYDYEEVCLNFYPEYPSDSTVTYTCSNEEVAFVNSFGRITGLKAGTAVITAVSTQGGFTDTLTVTVKGDASGDIAKITAGGYGILFLKNNKTAYAYGYGDCRQFGYYSASRYNYLIPFCEDPKTMITGIEDIYSNDCCTYYTNPDGTFWAVGLISTSTWEVYNKPVQIMISEDAPLTDIIQADYLTVLRADGTVWVPGIENPALFRQLLTEDGVPLTGVKKIHCGVAVKYDGSVYEWPPSPKENYTAKRIKNDDGTFLSDVVDAYVDVDCYVFLKKDGTVWVKGNNNCNFLGTPELESSDEFIQVKTAANEYLTDVTQLVYNCFGTYALKGDGTVWSWGGWQGGNYGSGWLGIGPYNNEKIYATQVKTDAETPLTHVAELIEMKATRMIFVRDDGSVWWAGVVDQDYSDAGLYFDCRFYAEPMVIMGNQQIYMAKDNITEPYVNRNVIAVQLDKTVMSVKIGDSFTLSARVLPLDAENQNICWVSDNPEVANVSGSGVVTAKSSGTTVIRAMSYDDRGIYAECYVAVEDENPTEISIKKLPDKLTYLTEETLNTDGGMIYLTYANGLAKSLPLAASFCSGYDMSVPGSQRVTVTYAGLTVYYDITVNPAATVTSVEIKQPPTKTDYLKGEKLDTKGGVLTAWYSDGTSKEIDITSGMCSGYDLQTTGSQTVTVSLSGKSCTFVISVREPAVTRIILTAYPNKLVYNAFDSLLTDGGTIALRYENGKLSANIPITADMCSGYNMSKIGPQTVTVTYNGHSTSFAIEVYNNGDAAYIAMNTQPDQIYYYYNNQTTFNVTGASIMVHYKDGSNEIVALKNWMCSSIKTIGAVPDPQIVTVTYYGMTTTFAIRSINMLDTNKLTSIKVTKLPDKLNYICGESVDSTGGKVRLEYQDGLLFVTDMKSFIKSGYDKTTPGQSLITVKYGDKTDSFYVNYTEAEEEEDKVIDIYWGRTPNKTLYYLGDNLIVSDAYIWIVTQSGTKTNTNYTYVSEDMCSGYDLSKTGEQTVTVTFEGFTLTFKIWVSGLILENEMPSINIGKLTRVAAYFSPKTGTLKTLSWFSSNSSVATVDKYGLVTGKAEGTAVITAKVAGATLAASCTVTVTKEDIRVTGVHLSDTAKTLNLESRALLTATVEPDNAANKNVTWSSSNENVATVDENGLVTAVGTGMAEITAETEDGGYTASCIVTVAGSLDVRVTGISLNKNKLVISYKASERLTADVQPGNASDNSVIWVSSNTEVAVVDQNGVIIGVSRGIATITVRTADGDFAAVCEVEVKFQWWQWLLWVLMIGFLWY